MKRITRWAAAGVAALGLVAGLLATAPTASAAPRNGVCETGEFCLYYSSNHAGSRVDLTTSLRTYGSGSTCVKFVSTGSGRGQCVKNNTASVWNRTARSVTVFYNSDFGGVFQRVASGARVNLGTALKNNNASQVIGDTTVRFPLRTTQAKVKTRSPHWCYSTNSNCHHDYNAADIFAATGTAVVSPVDGTVMTTRVSSSGVGSTITIKDAFGRLWYMAHMNHAPGILVRPGAHVVKGQKVGEVGTSRHALGTSPHVHVDMRVGVSSRVSCSGSACAGYAFVNNQPLLREALAKLPAS